jgi:uncharacterized protein (TIGR03435 family)
MLLRVAIRAGMISLGVLMIQNLPAQTSPAQTSEERGSLEASRPMDPGVSPAFAVATVKPSNPDAPGGWAFPVEGNRVSCTNATIANMLVVAYGIHPKQIVDGPAWLSTEKYDVNGIPDAPGAPSLIQTQQMYRKLLADRFALKFHREVRSIPIYALTIAKGGPKLKVADPNGHLNTGNSGGGGQRTLRFTSMSMAAFALNMNFYEDRPVIDQTGLLGNYDFTLKWTYDMSRENDPEAPPSLFTAIREQLGLRVDAVKGPAEVFVIDQLERPSAN